METTKFTITDREAEAHTLSIERKLTNKIGQLQASKGYTDGQIQGLLLLAGLSYDTATRLMKGETGFSLNTAATMAKVLNCKISDIFELE